MLYYGLIFLPKNGRFEGVHPHCDNPAMSLHEAITTSSDKLRTLTRSRDIGVLSTGRVGSTHWDQYPKTLGCPRTKPINPSFLKFLYCCNFNLLKISFQSFTRVLATCCRDYSKILCAVAISKLNQLNISNINSARPLWVTYFGIFGCLQLATACRHHGPAGWFGRDGR